MLDSADHILEWKSAGYAVEVITVFTSFSTNKISPFVRKFLLESGFATPADMEKGRKEEDNKAMKMLGVGWQHWDFIDAAFRETAVGAVYPTEKELFSGKISAADRNLEADLENRLKHFSEADLILLPLGLGKHIDHALVRRVGEKAFAKNLIGYYADFPYALKLKNWTFRIIKQTLFLNKSIKTMSATKRNILHLYSSQMPSLFKSDPNYPEIILIPKSASI